MDLQGKRFLLIGGAGLIGSHLLDQLLQEDIKEAVVFDNFSRGTFENIENALSDSRVKIFEDGGDILHTHVLGKALNKIDGVFHFAALWLMHCHEYPRSAFEVNVQGTFNVLEACVENSVKKLVFSSSASVYGDALEEPMTEDHPFNNKNFYGATKISGEAMLRAFHHRYGLDYLGLRYMNVYGARQDYKSAYMTVIMKVLDAIDRNESPTIFGDGTEAFDFVGVEDCGSANLCAMRSSASDQFYNIGSGKRTTLKELVEEILKITESDLPIRYEKRNQATLVTNRIGATEKALNDLGFMASISLEEGIRKLIEWRASDRIKSQLG